MRIKPRESNNNKREVSMYDEMMRLLNENDMDTFVALYDKYAHTLSLKQVDTIVERLKIKVTQQTLINQELQEELNGLTKMEGQLKGIKESLDRANENRRRN